MNIFENTIIFKSDDDFYFKEEAGIKPNTVRFTEDPKEFADMIDFEYRARSEILYIEILNRRSPHLRFKRQLRDVSYFKENGCFILSWFHEDKNGIQEGYNAPIKTK